MKNVLIFQHAGVLGGSVKSLVRFVLSLSGSEYKAMVCLLNPSKEVIDYHIAYKIPIIINNDIFPVFHTSGSWFNYREPISCYSFIEGCMHWRRSEIETLRVLDNNHYDIVHLNSSILLPSAFALHRAGIKFIWHVRESPQPRYFGTRLRLFRKWLRDLPTVRIFLSASDRLGWMGSDDCGVVIPNSVDREIFNLEYSSDVRSRLGLLPTQNCLLYLGGFSRIKGIFVLLEALEVLNRQGVDVVCLMPGTVRVRGQSIRSRLGRLVLNVTVGGTDEMRALYLIEAKRLISKVKFLPFERDIKYLLQSSDMVLFPSTVPHFAMPVIEAAAAGIPVVASNFDGMRELVEHQKTGLLVPPGDGLCLAEAMQSLLSSPERRKQMGLYARERAMGLYLPEIENNNILNIYDRMLKNVS